MTDPQNPNQPPAYGEQPTPPAYPQPTPPPYPQSAPPAYGAAVYQAGVDGPVPVPGRTLGIVAFVLSFFMQLFGLILGIVALVQSRKAGQKNGFALAAIIISSVLMVVGIIIGIVFLTYFANLANEVAQNCGPGGSGFVDVWGQQVPCSEVTQ